MNHVPTITTPRLILRPMRIEDFGAYRELMMSERSRFMGGPFTLEYAWGMFCHDAALWSLFGHGALMIDLKDDNTCIGQVGINAGPLFPEHELGWMLYDGFEGHGYVTEAASALRHWAWGYSRVKTLVSYIDPQNTASIGVAERLSARRDDNADRPSPEDLVYRHSVPD